MNDDNNNDIKINFTVGEEYNEEIKTESSSMKHVKTSKADDAAFSHNENPKVLIQKTTSIFLEPIEEIEETKGSSNQRGA